MIGDPTAANLEQFAHAVQHVWARTGHPAARLGEADMVHDCWGYPVTEPPPWALQAVQEGQPAALWCPILNPRLITRDTP